MREITQTDHDTGEEVVVDSMPIPFPYQRMKPLVGSASEAGRDRTLLMKFEQADRL